MVRSFNTGGPCRPEFNYMLPPLDRLPGASSLVDEGLYFAIHAPRQTGKTTVISALAADLTAAGRYAALAFSCERARDLADDTAEAQRRVLAEMRTRARLDLPKELQPPQWPDNIDLREALTEWSLACPLLCV